jgi:hypothetical protein
VTSCLTSASFELLMTLIRRERKAIVTLDQSAHMSQPEPVADAAEPSGLSAAPSVEHTGVPETVAPIRPENIPGVRPLSVSRRLRPPSPATA